MRNSNVLNKRGNSMANVKINLPEVEVGKVDYKVEIISTRKTKIGELHFSKGSVEWWPKGKSVNAITFSWKDLAAALEMSEKGKRLHKPKKTAGKRSTTAKTTTAPTRKRSTTSA